MTIQVRKLEECDREWAGQLLTERWGSTRMVIRGVLYDLTTMPGFVAHIDGEPVGLVTHQIANGECEIMSLDSLVEGKGVGTALIDAVRGKAVRHRCRRIRLITTNDNTHALRFYQKRGFRLAAVYLNALEQSRRLKPEIPLVGMDGIPLRDEIELEFML